MSVYTRVSREALEAFLTEYDVGNLVDFEGISAGIENTNYFVDTTSGRFVLTLFEHHDHGSVNYFLTMMHTLSLHHVACADPVADKGGGCVRTLCGKPAALVQRLDGSGIDQPQTVHCAAIGNTLGQIHAVAQQSTLSRENERGPQWWRPTAELLKPEISNDVYRLIDDEIRFQLNTSAKGMPRGFIHADLFRDNALFRKGKLVGVIDFYSACTDILLYDVAITLNDWCISAEGQIDVKRGKAFMQAYHGERPFNEREKEAWHTMLRAAALRFWLSRLYDLHFPRAGEITHIKDPDHFKRILLDRRDNPTPSMAIWPS